MGDELEREDCLVEEEERERRRTTCWESRKRRKKWIESPKKGSRDGGAEPCLFSVLSLAPHQLGKLS